MLTKTSRRKLPSNESQISSKSDEATEKLENKLKTKKTTFGGILSEVTAKKGNYSHLLDCYWFNHFRLEIRNCPIKQRGIYSTREFKKVKIFKNSFL